MRKTPKPLVRIIFFSVESEEKGQMKIITDCYKSSSKTRHYATAPIFGQRGLRQIPVIETAMDD